MNLIEVLLFVVLPLTAVAIFIIGLVWQYDSKETYRNNLVKNLSCLIFASIAFITGIGSIVTQGFNHTAVEWMMDLFLFDFQGIKLLYNAPVLVKIHMVSFCLLLILLPFTKYIKILTIQPAKRYL